MKKIFIVILIIFFSNFILHSQQDLQIKNTDVLTLKQIDKLIKDTDYDIALTELAKYMTIYPDSFDSVQLRIKKILDARNNYSFLADKLFDVIVSDPNNNDNIFNLTQQLKTLERHPSDTRLKFFKDIELAAEFNYYRAQFNSVLSESSKLALENKFIEGLDKARSGFYMYKDDFDEKYQNSKIWNNVYENIKKIDENIQSYKTIFEGLLIVKEGYIKAVNSKNFMAIDTEQKRVVEVFSKAINFRNKIVESSILLENELVQIKKIDKDLTDASFIPFVIRFIYGIDEYKYSGIVGNIDRNLDLYTTQMKEVTESLINIIAKDFIDDDYKKDGVINSSLKLNDISFLCDKISKINDICLSANNNSSFIVLSYLDSKDFSLRMNSFMQLCNNFDLVVDYYNLLQNQIELSKNIIFPDNPHKEEKITYPDRNLKIALETEKIYADLNKITFPIVKNEYKVLKELNSYQNKIYKDIQKEINNFIISLWINSSLYYEKASLGFVDELTLEKDKALNYLNGIYNQNTNRTEFFPSEAYALAEKQSELNKKINSSKNILQDGLKKIDSKYKENYTKQISVIQDSINKLNILTSDLAKISTDSRSRIVLSNKAKNEGDLRFNQAQNALKRQEFDTARKRLNEAQIKYNESLNYQESLEFRTLADKNISDLGTEILTKENEVVVQDVRRLKINARKEYYAGNFESASNLLNQAQARWATTNIEEDSEITSFMQIVERARKMTTGRKLQKTDPLYTEMSQILSLANQYYKQGENLINKGKKDEGLKLLNQSLQKINELKIVYPQNQAASLLTLRIQKLQSPEEFNAQFAKKVEQTINTYNTTDDKYSAYNDLTVLYEMNSSYPNLEKILYNIKIDLGLIKKPVDKTNLIKSNQLVSQSEKIFSSAGRNELLLREALSKVDEALSLNPDNEDAMILKDRIQILIGGKAVIVLSSEDEFKYQEAVQRMNRNDTTGAIAIVNELLKKQNNKRSSKILDLMKQLEVRTGIKFNE